MSRLVFILNIYTYIFIYTCNYIKLLCYFLALFKQLHLIGCCDGLQGQDALEEQMDKDFGFCIDEDYFHVIKIAIHVFLSVHLFPHGFNHSTCL